MADIDWAEVRARLARAGDSEAASRAPTDEADAAVLQARARALAAARVEAAPSAQLELVVFRWSDERYALPSTHVLRVVVVEDVTRVPGAPAVVRGIVRHEGEVLPLFDPRALLGVASAAEATRGEILVLGDERPDLGLLVDAVVGITAIATDALKPAPGGGEGARRPWVQGVTTEGLIVLDPEAVLADPRLAVGERLHPT